MPSMPPYSQALLPQALPCRPYDRAATAANPLPPRPSCSSRSSPPQDSALFQTLCLLQHLTAVLPSLTAQSPALSPSGQLAANSARYCRPSLLLPQALLLPG